MTRKLTTAERTKRERERKRGEKLEDQARERRTQYLNDLVSAALKERSSGQFPNPPHPPPPRIARPPRPDSAAMRPVDDVRWTPVVLNQFHPDYDWRAALRYYAITGDFAGRSIVELVMLPGFDRALFGSHAKAWNDALRALNALAEWCRRARLPPIFEAFSPLNAERFMEDGVKAGLALRTLDNRRGVYASLWDVWGERERSYAEHLQGGPCEPIDNPWRLPEVKPAVVLAELTKRKARKERTRTPLRVVSEASLKALAKGRERIAIRTNEHHARIRQRIKQLEAEGVVSNKALAEALNSRGALGRRDGLQDATSVRRHRERVSEWGPRPT